MSGKTVFISYRRDSVGRAFARSIKQELTRHGYDVFFDVDSMDSGRWEQQILTQVPQRSHFLLLLTPGALDRCEDKGDWVRREFETAVQRGRNIVPIREESVDLAELKKTCPAAMKRVFEFQIPTVRQEGFEDDIEELIERYIPPHKAPQESPVTSFEFRADISRIIKYAPAELIGRENELKILSDAWQQAVNGHNKRPHILTFVALGGEGKTSLVAKWAAQLAHDNWPGCKAAFAWSFYSQGTSDKTQASSDSFLKEALLFFGDEKIANSAVGSFDKGRRLAQLIGERKALLILDGLEPLQYAPTSPTGSELKDQGVSALLKALATNNAGLCVVTTRYSIPDLRNFWQSTAPEIKLTSLSNEAGVALLRTLGMKGTQKEFEQLVKDVKGHALTLNLLGSYLCEAHAGDIRKRDLVKLEEANAEEQSGHAFHVMDAYVKSFKDEGEKGRRALAILRMLGLFDRPATADCLNALWTGDEIGGLTGPLIGTSEPNRNITLKRLEDSRLIAINRDESSELLSLDAHPLLREYFAKQVREQLPGAWRAAHRRLYEYLSDNTHEGDNPALEDLQPLYQAVAHGCYAGLHLDVYEKVYLERIGKGSDNYAVHHLGAFSSDLGAVACFFEQPWSRPASAFSEVGKATLRIQAAFRLRAVGRVAEALEATQAATEWATNEQDWERAPVGWSNLSELALILGNVVQAVSYAERSVDYSGRGGDQFVKMHTLVTHAQALLEAGGISEALAQFAATEHMQKQTQSRYPLLYSTAGYSYCDALLCKSERAAWQRTLGLKRPKRERQIASTNSISERARKTLKWAEIRGYPLDIGLNQLTLARAALYARTLDFASKSKRQFAFDNIGAAVPHIRSAGAQEFIVSVLVTHAWISFLSNGESEAHAHLEEAWEIAERGPMRLHMADIHLYRARLFHAVKPYPWKKFPDGTEGRGPKDDLKDARALIEQCGYWRRKEELEDAEEAAQNWT